MDSSGKTSEPPHPGELLIHDSNRRRHLSQFSPCLTLPGPSLVWQLQASSVTASRWRSVYRSGCKYHKSLYCNGPVLHPGHFYVSAINCKLLWTKVLKFLTWSSKPREASAPTGLKLFFSRPGLRLFVDLDFLLKRVTPEVWLKTSFCSATEREEKKKTEQRKAERCQNAKKWGFDWKAAVQTASGFSRLNGKMTSSSCLTCLWHCMFLHLVLLFSSNQIKLYLCNTFPARATLSALYKNNHILKPKDVT